jgi:hypothetical protein
MIGQDSMIIKLPYSLSSASAINRAMQAAVPKVPRAAASAAASKQVMPAKITTHFSQSQLALALTIQKMKPEALATNGKSATPFCHFLTDVGVEYFQQLRNSIKAGQPVSTDGLRYIDTCEFWKDQYTKIHLEKNVLQDKIHRLEEARRQLLESLHGQCNHTLPHSPSGIFIGGPEVNELIPNEASRKRPAPSQEEMAEYKQEGDVDCSSSEDNFLRVNSYGELQPRSHIPNSADRPKFSELDVSAAI